MDPYVTAQRFNALEVEVLPGPEAKLSSILHILAYPLATPDLEQIIRTVPASILFEDEQPTQWSSPAGYWGTTYVHGDGQQYSFGRILIDDLAPPAIDFQGFGADSAGDFIVWGSTKGRRIIFVKDHGVTNEGESIVTLFKGSVDEDFMEITGTWCSVPSNTLPTLGSDPWLSQDVTGNDDVDDKQAAESKREADEGDEDTAEEWETNLDEDEDSGGEDSEQTSEEENGDDGDSKGEDERLKSSASASDADVQLNALLVGTGTFILKRHSELSILFRPDEEEMNKNRSRALWKFALNAVLLVVRRGDLRWTTLKDRRERRAAYTRLLLDRQQNDYRLPPEKELQWKEIVQKTPLDDLRLWKLLVDFYTERSQINHE